MHSLWSQLQPCKQFAYCKNSLSTTALSTCRLSVFVIFHTLFHKESTFIFIYDDEL